MNKYVGGDAKVAATGQECPGYKGEKDGAGFHAEEKGQDGKDKQAEHRCCPRS